MCEKVVTEETEVVGADIIEDPDTIAVSYIDELRTIVVYCAVTVQGVIGAVEVTAAGPVVVGSGLK
jgi:hypothetical protein